MAVGTVRLGVDVGGTFTDVALEAGDKRYLAKVLTTPQAPEQGILTGMAAALAQAGLTPSDLDMVIHGTTLGANALIERKGALTAFLTTQGHRDTLEIATESRFDLYDLHIDKPEPLVPRARRFTVAERMDAAGQVLVPLDEDGVVRAARAVVASGATALAIGFLHAYANPDHERRAGEIVAAVAPGLDVTLASDVAPEMREYERFSTAVANAYIRRLMGDYLGRLEAALAARGVRCPLLLMLSNGGLTSADVARRLPIRLVESGPAGGAVFGAEAARALGLDEVIAFDMGGTTAKVCLVDGGRPQTARSFEVARRYRFLKGSGLPLRVPVIELVEIGAGGGSIARLDSLGRIAVGPDSAGSEPGPVCYARGGTMPTVTDANLLLGRLDAAAFAGGSLHLDQPATERAMQGLAGPLALDLPLAAAGITETIDEAMSAAARVHCIESGKDVVRRTLLVSGGAAPLHAARLAQKLGLARVVVPRDAGVGSAVGFLRAPVAFELVRSRYQRLDRFDEDLMFNLLAELRDEAEAMVRDAAPGPLKAQAFAYARYVGQGHELEVPVDFAPDGATLAAAFAAEYQRQYGRLLSVPVEVLAWRVRVAADAPTAPPPVFAAGAAAAPIGRTDLFDPGLERIVAADIWLRDALAPGQSVSGPAIVRETNTSTVVPPGFTAQVHDSGALVLTRGAA